MGSKLRRCGIYVRCSTGEQSTDSQLTALKEFAVARGWQIHKVYEDHAISGTKAKRPGLDAMWADCRQRKIDICLVFALDRLARSLKHLIEALEEFGRLGVDFVCLKQDIDTTSVWEAMSNWCLPRRIESDLRPHQFFEVSRESYDTQPTLKTKRTRALRSRGNTRISAKLARCP